MNSEQKLAKFQQVVSAAAAAEKEAILNEGISRRKATLADAESEFLERAFHIIQNGVSGIESEGTKKISSAQLESRRSLLALREALAEKTFSAVEERLAAFAAGEDYPAFLSGTIATMKEALGEGRLILFCRKADRELVERLTAGTEGLTLQESEEILLGGVRILSEERGILTDETLDRRLAEEKEAFLQWSGLSVVS